ncbi:hypothetical protein Aph01nite_55920 [Acrocarpospora phusangensis]|uniref:Uncharacterized protein n=1 Tax=Acrocarpospora phusangensis TaxID=1070424 RepID=A0A919QJE8_9ACTN|nr:hypothetical protein [Acrocarpospora phusangensis]GIH27282.1 hypothetical protein Aph01nite_55920 [Acrocarpospora phusangensis]
MNFCLSDLVPPLRWSDAATIPTPPDLPDAWWRSLPMSRVLAAVGPSGLADLLTDLTLSQWRAAAVGDILPALHVLHPDDADDPQVAIALDRAGSWTGLLALTGRELADQPFVKVRPVLTALFGAVFARLAQVQGARAPLALRPWEPARAEAAAVSVSAAVGAVAGGSGADLCALLDGVFAELDDQTWMVAQNRVFTDTPTAVEELGRLLAVPAGLIEAMEKALRARLEEWLESPGSAPFRTHLERVAALLGVAAPKTRLINAAPWHEEELRSLDVLAWQFVLASLPGYQVDGEWLVAGDMAELQEKTRKLIVNSDRPPTVNRARELVSSLGIRPEVAKEWLENVPQLRIQSGNGKPKPRPRTRPAPLPSPVPEAEPELLSQAPEPQPEPQPEPAPEAQPEPKPKPAPKAEPKPVAKPVPKPPPRTEPKPKAEPGFKDVAHTRRCFRQPDGRWWLRVDVTAEYLTGAEIPLPSGFASYLGLAPGETKSVRSAAGDVELTWQSHPAVGSLQRILTEVAAKEGGHIFLTLSEEGMLRVRHLPSATGGDNTSRALRLVGYTAPGGTPDQAVRVIATRIGLTGPIGTVELLARLRERGDRDLLSLLG